MTSNPRPDFLCLCANSVSLWLSSFEDRSAQRHGVPQRHREILFRRGKRKHLSAGLIIVIAMFLIPLRQVRAQIAQPLEDPAIEQRMRNLTKQLRCLVCQNETLADSQAPLAEDLRREIRAQI